MNVDGDRVAFVTAAGRALSEEHTLPLAAEARLARRPGPIVTNLSTSRMVDLVAARHGQPVIRTSVGEGLVMDRGLEEGAALAGEGNGGIGVLPASMTFDAMLTLGLMLEGMASRGDDPAEVVARLPRLAMRKGVVPCSPDQVYKRLESFRSAYAARAPDLQDGVRVEWPDGGWLHVRASNTEPLLRIIVEAESEARAAELYEEALALSRRAEPGRKEA
jgi:phosphomannomutase